MTFFVTNIEKMVDESNIFYFILEFAGRVFGLSIHVDIQCQTLDKHGVVRKIWQIMELGREVG